MDDYYIKKFIDELNSTNYWDDKNYDYISTTKSDLQPLYIFNLEDTFGDHKSSEITSP